MGLITAGQSFTGKVGVAFSQTPASTGVVSSWSATGLPAGLSINATSGLISGTPAAKGSATAALTATEFLAAIRIAAGRYYSFALKNDGTVVGWGWNGEGQTAIPSGLSGVIAISAAWGQHSLALKNDGTVVAWGYSGYGAAVIPSGLSGVIAISGSYYHSLALKNDGTVVAWGDIHGGGRAAIPPGLSGVIAISNGAGHSLALKNDGTVVAWGESGGGRTAVPSGLSGVIAISGGFNHSLALKSDGTVVAWGYNDYGQSAIPSGLSGVIAISGGDNYSLALKNDGTVVAWGRSSEGQITIPSGLSGVIAIAAGGNHSLALKNDGAVVAWGTNNVGQTAVPASSLSVAVAFTITEGAPIITAGQTLVGAVGAAFSRTPALTDSANRPVTSWAATGLPSWATLNTATGEITGTQQVGSTVATLTATGPGGVSDEVAVTIAVIVPLVVTWPEVDVRVGEQVAFFATTGTLPGGIQAGVYYFVRSKVGNGGFTVSSTLGGSPLAPTNQTWTGTYKARLKSRACRGGTSDIQYIGLSPGEGAAWDSEAGSMMLWGYNATTSTATISRLLKAEDIEYADLSAMDWVISGVTPPPQDGTLRTERVVNHRLVDGAMLANWPSGGEVLVDLDGRNAVAVQEATMGELTIAPGYTRNLRIAMLSHLDGVPGLGNLCSLYIKFFPSHASVGIDEYRSGGGDGWAEVLAFGAPWNVVSEASVPVTGAYAVYKIVRGSDEFTEVISVSLRMRLE